MITLTGNGRLTRDPSCAPPTRARRSPASRSPATAATATRGRDLHRPDPLGGAGHRGRRTPRQGPGRQLRRPLRAARVRHQAGDQRVALELHGVDLEYGAKPRSNDTEPAAQPEPAATRDDGEDIPF